MKERFVTSILIKYLLFNIVIHINGLIFNYYAISKYSIKYTLGITLLIVPLILMIDYYFRNVKIGWRSFCKYIGIWLIIPFLYYIYRFGAAFSYNIDKFRKTETWWYFIIFFQFAVTSYFVQIKLKKMQSKINHN